MFFKKIEDCNKHKLICPLCRQILDTCKVLRDDTTRDFIKFMRERELVVREHDDYFVCLLCVPCIDKIEKIPKSKRKRRKK